MNFNAIQFIGTQRSGSNLLRLMLDSHSQISAPHPPHLLKTFRPLLEYYGDLSKMRNRSNLVNDMCDWVEANPVPWEGTMLSRGRIIEESSTIIDVFRLIYEARMQLDKANIWCCKSTFNINFVGDLESVIKPFYIYLYRDGRDVATSFKKAIVGPKHIYHLARKWSSEQEAAREFLSGIPTKRYISLSYEDLLGKPEGSVQEICEKLGIIYESEMLHFYTSNESRRTADSGEMWKNVLKPVLRNNSGKYLKELPDSDIALFESIAGNELQALGYQRASHKSISFEHEIPLYEAQNSQMQFQVKQNAPVQDKSKREAQDKLMKKIQERLQVSRKSHSPV